jgi:uncharacterized protein with FMN-binding domain
MADKKVANSLLALSSAAVLAVYAAGYERTKAAATRFAVQAEERRPASVPQPVVSAPPAPEVVGLPVPKPARRKAPRQAVERVAPAVPTVELAPVVIAAPPPEPPPAPPAPPKPTYRDGTYLGWGTSRHGDIQAQVVIEDGRIKAATIAQCLTRYSCNVIVNLPPQVAQRQSPETDYVSGATQSTNAFYFAVVEALSKAK